MCRLDSSRNTQRESSTTLLVDRRPLPLLSFVCRRVSRAAPSGTLASRARCSYAMYAAPALGAGFFSVEGAAGAF